MTDKSQETTGTAMDSELSEWASLRWEKAGNKKFTCRASSLPLAPSNCKEPKNLLKANSRRLKTQKFEANTNSK